MGQNLIWHNKKNIPGVKNAISHIGMTQKKLWKSIASDHSSKMNKDGTNNVHCLKLHPNYSVGSIFKLASDLKAQIGLMYLSF